MVVAGGFGYALGRFVRGLGKLEVAGGEGIPVELGWFTLENSLKEKMGASSSLEEEECFYLVAWV